MQDKDLSKYFYGDEAMQFSYFRIPRQLITHPRFKPLSADAKLLYGLLLDRMGLSIKDKWYDSDRRGYIYYTVDEVCVALNCGRDKAMKLLAELDTSKSVGLMERVRQGQGKPAQIYALRFTTQELPSQQEDGTEPPILCLEIDFDNVQESDFPAASGRDIRCVEAGKTDPNYNNIMWLSLLISQARKRNGQGQTLQQDRAKAAAAEAEGILVQIGLEVFFG